MYIVRTMLILSSDFLDSFVPFLRMPSVNSQKGRFNYVASCDFPSFRGCSEVVATKDHFQRIRGLLREGAVGASAPKHFQLLHSLPLPIIVYSSNKSAVPFY